MARPIDKIIDVNEDKETWKFAVKIVELWTSFNRHQEDHYEMIFLDEAGDRIYAIVPKIEMHKWRGKLREDMTAIIRNFKACPNDFAFKKCTHPYKLLFTHSTSLGEQSLPQIQHPKYVFKDFEHILNQNYDAYSLYDFIGAVSQLLHIPTDAQTKAYFTLTDLRGHTVHCTLWDGYAKQFQEAYSQRNPTKPFVIIVTNMRINQPRGIYPLTLANSFYCTKAIFNQELPEINEFINSIPPTQSLQLSTHLSSQITQSRTFSEYDRFMYNAKALSISQIKKLRADTNCTTVGTTYKLLTTKGGWTIPGCMNCPKPWNKNPPHQCYCGAITEDPIIRYKVDIEVRHMNDKYSFTFWDKECEGFLGISAVHLRNRMIEEGEDDPNEFPQPLDNLLNLTLAFRVKVTPKWNAASVSKFSADEVLIAKILDQIQHDEDGDSTLHKGKSLLSESEVPNFELLSQQTFSGTADFDPDLVITNSPPKMLTLGESAADLKSPESSTAKVTSTKILTNIKIEK